MQTHKRGSKAVIKGRQLTAGCDQRVSPTHPPPLLLGQSSSDVKPHLEAAVNTAPVAQPKSPLLLTAVVWPRSCSLSRANADHHTARCTRSQCWESAGLKWALAYSKTNTRGKGMEMPLLASLWDAATLASARKSVPILSSPVKLIIKHLQ